MKPSRPDWTADPRVPALLAAVGTPVIQTDRRGDSYWTALTQAGRVAIRKLERICGEWLISMDGEPDQNARAWTAPDVNDVLAGLAAAPEWRRVVSVAA